MPMKVATKFFTVKDFWGFYPDPLKENKLATPSDDGGLSKNPSIFL